MRTSELRGSRSDFGRHLHSLLQWKSIEYFIRGQVADTFFNGMRIGLTSEGVGAPIDFNAVESVNIVKGPAPAVYGASQNVGGFIDLTAETAVLRSFSCRNRRHVRRV